MLLRSVVHSVHLVHIPKAKYPVPAGFPLQPDEFRFINDAVMDWIVYILYRTLARCIILLPVGASFRIGTCLGWLAYWALWPYRRLAIENLTIAFGAEKSRREIRGIARRHFSRLGANLFTSIKLASVPPEEISKRVTFEGREFVDEAVAEGRGVVLIISHLGNWEALAQTCPLIFHGASGTIYQRLGNRYIDAEIRASRARLGIVPFERKSGFLGAIAFLRQAGGVGVLVDQHAGDSGTWCPFFGRLASTSPLAATLALRTDARMLAAAVYTDKPGHWRMVIEKPDFPPTRDGEVLTAEINLVLERQIRRAPEDWFWVHNRWKTPKPNFLLADYKRGIALPSGFDAAQLKPFPVVVRSSNWLGDAVMTVPAIQAIKRGRPDVRLTILTKAKLAEFWKRVPEGDEVITIEPNDSVFAVARKLRGKFEAAVVLPNSIRSALEVWLAGIPRRAGYAAEWRRKLLNQPFAPSPKKTQLPRPARHQVHHYLDLVNWLGANSGDLSEAAFFNNPRPARSGNGVVKLGLCPGAEYGPAKRWLPERFAEVARTVAQQVPCEWLLFGVAGDAAVGETISHQLDGKCTNLIGKTNLAELMDRISECELLLTNDTGTMHLAAFLGVPVVAIFGSTEPRLTAPLGPGHRVLRHQVECSPCFLRECPLDFRCMNAVTAQETVAAVLGMVRTGPGLRLP
ncbi:MAG: glycosyltransferase family 9 protein [Verrucomicrobiota bacterium]